MGIKESIINFGRRKEDRKDTSFLALNSICSSLNKYIERELDQKLNREQYKGIVFCCNKDLFKRYSDDFGEILDIIGYLSYAQSIPTSDRVNDYLKQRLKENLPKEIEQSRSRGAKGSTDLFGVISVGGEFTANTKAVHDRPETLIGLIENVLQLRKLMLIITNAEDFDFQDLKLTIDDVFAAGISFEHKAALTLVHSFSSHSNDLWQAQNLFVFNPQNIIEQKDLIDFVWTRLKPKQQEFFGNSEILKNYLSKTQGSTVILRQKWNERWGSNNIA